MGGFLQCFEWYFDIQILNPRLDSQAPKDAFSQKSKSRRLLFLTPSKIHVLKWEVFCSVLNGTLTFRFRLDSQAPLVNLTWGLNSKCQSSIHNIAKNVSFQYMNLTWGQKSSLLDLDFWENAAFGACESNLGLKNLNVKVPFKTLQKTSHFSTWILLGVKKRSLLDLDFWENAAFGAC